MNRRDFQRLATERLDDATALQRSGRYACAYYIAGYVIECALKACIARQTKQDEFPPKNAAKYYVHDIQKLLDIAGLGSHFDAEAKGDPAFRANWAVVKDSSEESRYQSPIQQQAQDILDAIGDSQHGVLQWLRKNW
jgi:hypothetical protein